MRSTRFILPALAALLCSYPVSASDDYNLGPDSLQQPGVPRGETTRYSIVSKVFPGTHRDYSVYVPKQYDPARSACVMFFQDGGGGLNVNTVFDNLIFKKEMPVTIAVMIPPGVVPAAGADALPRYNRSHEYDGMSGDYARFLIEEILPAVGSKLNISKDPNDRGLCGASSGGIAAFTAAWQRPDEFRRVASFVGSFTDLQGGNVYNSLIRKFEPKPLRNFLQEGSNDQDIYSGSWPNGNKDIYDALKYNGYDVKFVLGDGPHSGRHGASILPDVLRWLWRDYPKPIQQPAAARWPMDQAWIPGEDWTPADVGGDIGGLAADDTGAVWVTLPSNHRIVCVTQDGSLDRTRDITAVGAPSGIAVGPDGRLFVCDLQRKRIVRIQPPKPGSTAFPRVDVFVESAVSSHIVVNHAGDAYYTDDRDGKIYLVPAHGKRRMVSDAVARASGITITPDQTFLLVTQATESKWGYSLQIKVDGGLTNCQAFYDLHLPYGALTSGAVGLVTDSNGWFYVSSTDGIQMLDQAGRVNAILSNPGDKPAILAFGGSDRMTLYAGIPLMDNSRVLASLYRRRLKAKGVLPFEQPIKPPAPRL